MNLRERQNHNARYYNETVREYWRCVLAQSFAFWAGLAALTWRSRVPRFRSLLLALGTLAPRCARVAFSWRSIPRSLYASIKLRFWNRDQLSHYVREVMELWC